MKKIAKLALILSLCMIFGACQSNTISSQTKDAVSQKTKEVLALYATMAQTIDENSIVVDQSFRDLKQQLTNMSEQLKVKLEEATEQDGIQAIQELERIEDNLKETKKSIDQHIVKE